MGDSSSDDNMEEKEELDFIEIADVEKFVSRRLSKGDQDDDQNKYELSPKMNRLLGKFCNEPREFTDTEEQRVNLISAEKNFQNENKTKKKVVKFEEIKPQPKMARRNSVNETHFL